MNSLKFIREFRKLESKLRKRDTGVSMAPFPLLIKQLEDANGIDVDTASDLKKLWELVRKLYSAPVLEENVSTKSEALLILLMNNSKLP